MLVLSIIPFTVQSDDDTPQPYFYEYMPENTFGIPYMKTVNWSYFRELFNQYCDWELEYKRYSYNEWTDGNDYLTIEKQFNETLGGWKFNLILDVPVDVYSARFTFACNLNVLNYVERDGYQVNLNYTIPGTNETYNCYFNWSDMFNIPNIEFSKGILNNKFWFRFKKDNIPSGQYEFDPWFGYQGGTASKNINDRLRYGKATQSDGSGYGDNITVFLDVNGVVSTSSVKCALYFTSDDTLVPNGITEEKSWDTSFTNTWIVFNFTTQPYLYDATEYYIAVWGDTTGAYAHSFYVGSHPYYGYDNEVYNGFPEPLSVSMSNGELAIYCSYTLGGIATQCPESSGFSIANKSANVDINIGYWNVTIEDPEGANTNGSINCSNGNTTIWTEQPNGTRTLNLSQLDYGTNYTVWLNFTDGECNVSETFWFTTGICETLITNENPLNNTIELLWNDLNLSVDINTTLGCEIDYVNISLSNGSYLYYINYTSGYSNRSFWLNETFNLTVVTTYYWWVNTSSGGLKNHSWFNFTTKDITHDDLFNLLNNINTNMLKGDDDILIGFETGQFLLIIVGALMVIFIALGESIKKKEHFSRGICFMVVWIIGMFGGVALTQVIDWFIPFVYITLSGFYGFRAFINFGLLKKDNELA